jgi:AraC family transcriptional regulator of adaptative response / DNA-3-methyladenine glycosylase II
VSPGCWPTSASGVAEPRDGETDRDVRFPLVLAGPVGEDGAVLEDPTTLYRAVSGRDRRFDGRFVFGVTSTGIYCRPSCPARVPRPENVRYFAVPAAANAAGFRPCKRCRPDALPGSGSWDARGDLVGRALRLIGDGGADEHGVEGLATQLHVTPRHLHRVLVAEVGATPQQLARTRRAQTARLLLEQTELSVTDVAYAAGFASIRQFNDVVREQFHATPTQVRSRRSQPDRPAEAGVLTLRLALREPFDAGSLFGFLRARAVVGVEQFDDRRVERSLTTAYGSAVVVVERDPAVGGVTAHLRLPDLAALPSVVTAVRRWLDLDADVAAVDQVLATDPYFVADVVDRPGVRVPGALDGFEVLMRAIVGQQVSVAAAATTLGRLVAAHGLALSPGPAAGVQVTHTFPTPDALADAGPTAGREVGLTRARAATVHAAAAAVAAGRVRLVPGSDRDDVRRRLLQLPGIGPWTAEYVVMRALSDPDAWPDSDLLLRREVRRLGLHAERWRPWRSYAALRMWTRPPTAPDRR